MMYNAKLLLFVVLAFGAFTQIFAAAGDVDMSFGEEGIVLTDHGFELEGVVDLAIQPDGKIIAAGYSLGGQNPSDRIIFVRYNVNGSIDTTFGTNGKVIIPSRSPGQMALQPDGKIVFVSPEGESPFASFYVGRLNSDGSFDTTFNGSGTVNVLLRGSDDMALSVKIQPDGKILAGGMSSIAFSSAVSDFAIVRLNANGSFDTTFDGDGKVFTTIRQPLQTESFSQLTLQPDGKIVAVGTIASYDANNQLKLQEFVVARYNSNGSLDTTFDSDGIVITQFPEQLPSLRTDVSPTAVALQSDGKIVVAGDAIIFHANNDNIIRAALARYNTDGSLDTSFANGGKALISLPPHIHSSAYDMAIQADNKIVFAGDAGGNNGRDTMVARLNTNGSLDTTFSNDGWNLIVGPPNRFSPAYAVAIQPNGKIVTGGWNGWFSGSNYMLARFESVTCTVNCPAPRREVIADFDGDGKTDLSVYRSGTWFINSSSANNPHSYSEVQFGFSNPDYLTPADYDGDGKTDLAVWRTNYANTSSAFLVLRSATNTFRTTVFGLAGDDPRVVGDWDFDGKADIAVYRSGASAGQQSYFYYIPSTAPETSVVIPWGLFGDEAVRGDFDGDGRMDAAVYRPSNQIWYVRKSTDGQPIFQYWGLATDKRVSGDFDGDGKTDFTVYRDGVWYVLQSTNNQPRYAYWGTSSDRIVAGDYDGDGKADFAVWRAGVYYIMQNSNMQPLYYHFGIPSDIPVASAYVR